tara:strand:+ start:521 stop:868 length:348 start_codon:yes stop_codon:yes gene_type:complete
MATFPNIKPTYGQKKNSSPNTRIIRFGDGYEHRLLFGLNQNPKEFSLSFDVSETDADTIETFLDARAEDSASFTFTPPGEPSSSQFVCESWSKSIPYNNRANITATFREVFEPTT